MLSMERVIEIARDIVEKRQQIDEAGSLALIDNTLRDGIELARAVNGGYVSQLTTTGERRLMVAYNAVAALRDTLVSHTPRPPCSPVGPWAEVTNIEVIDGFTRLTDRSNLVVHLNDVDHTAYAMPDGGKAFLEADQALMNLGYTVPAFGWRHEPQTTRIRSAIQPIKP